MNASWIVVFAIIAAVGNALFALGQRQSAGFGNGLVFMAASAVLAALLAVIASPLAGPVDAVALRGHWKPLLLSSIGLFLTYLGFNLLYTRFGAAPYVVYAVLSVLTTSVGVGYLYLKEDLNRYHLAAMVLAVLTVVIFSLGQMKK